MKIDEDKINEILDLEPVEQKIEIDPEQYKNREVDETLEDNISKLTTVFDRLLEDISNGHFDSEAVLAAAQIGNAITSASIAKKDNSFEMANLILKAKQLNIRAQEVKIKQKSLEKGEKNSGKNTLVVTDRETLLDMMKNGDEKKLLGE